MFYIYILVCFHPPPSPYSYYCSSLFVVFRCVLFVVVYCSLVAVRCSLIVVRFSLFAIVCCMLFIVPCCYMLFVVLVVLCCYVCALD